MKSAVGALVAVVVLSAAVDASELVCPNLITDPKVIDSWPDVYFDVLNEEFLSGAFFFNKTGKVYRMDFSRLNTADKRHSRELTLVDHKCASLKLRYRHDREHYSFKAESAELLLKQSDGSLVRDCSVRDPERYFGDVKQHGKQIIECYDDSGAHVTTLIVNRFQLYMDPFGGADQ